MLHHNISLSNYTAWRVGGPARQVYIPDTVENLAAFLKNLPAAENILFLGLGSNVLIRDGGFNGTVIINHNKLHTLENNTTGIITLGSGIACGTAARLTARNGWGGLEFLAGVPGTIGGALAMNAGAHKSETWDFIDSCEVINRHGDIYTRRKQDYNIGYREISLKKEKSLPEWFLAGCFKLPQQETQTSLLKIKQLLAHRAATQPINLPNCGSVFRNPPNQYAAALIEKCHLKGYKIGGAEVSTKHANFIISYPNATAHHIELLIHHIIYTVEKNHHVQLIPEVHLIGETACAQK